MADPTPSSEALALAFFTELVHLILAFLRLAALVIENSARLLDSSMQHVASTAFPNGEQADRQRPATPDTCAAECVYSDTTPPNEAHPTVAVADPESPAMEEGHDTARHIPLDSPVPIFCDPRYKSRRFYCVTVGRQIGVFDNRYT